MRNGLLLASLLLALWVVLHGSNGWLLGLLAAMALMASVIGRALFYVVVIPTTMPGAFFWRNQAFVDHARDTGLTGMEALGVVHERHHAFDLQALLQTIRQHSLKEMWMHTRAIFDFR